MNPVVFRIFIVSGLSVAFGACGIAEDCKNMDFSSLAKADRMRITTNHDKTIRETNDLAEISSLIHFISGRTENWCKPRTGIPIGLARAELYENKRLLGSISLGSNFAGAGEWRVRSLEKSEREELLRIFSIPDPYAK